MDIDLSRGFLVLIYATQTLTDQALDDKNGGQALEQFAETRLSLKK